MRYLCGMGIGEFVGEDVMHWWDAATNPDVELEESSLLFAGLSEGVRDELCELDPEIGRDNLFFLVAITLGSDHFIDGQESLERDVEYPWYIPD